MECGACSSSSMLESDAKRKGSSDVKGGANCDAKGKKSVDLPKGTMLESVEYENRGGNAVSYQCTQGQDSTEEGAEYQCSTIYGSEHVCPERVAMRVGTGSVWPIKERALQKVMLERFPINRTGNMRHV